MPTHQMSIESQRYDVNGIIKAYSDKMGSGIHELWWKHLQEITVNAGCCSDPTVFRLREELKKKT